MAKTELLSLSELVEAVNAVTMAHEFDALALAYRALNAIEPRRARLAAVHWLTAKFTTVPVTGFFRDKRRRKPA